MASPHEVWRDAANVRSVALNKAIELNAGRQVDHLYVLKIASDFADFLLGIDKVDIKG